MSGYPRYLFWFEDLVEDYEHKYRPGLRVLWQLILLLALGPLLLFMCVAIGMVIMAVVAAPIWIAAVLTSHFSWSIVLFYIAGGVTGIGTLGGVVYWIGMLSDWGDNVARAADPPPWTAPQWVKRRLAKREERLQIQTEEEKDR